MIIDFFQIHLEGQKMGTNQWKDKKFYMHEFLKKLATQEYASLFALTNAASETPKAEN